MLLTPLLFRTIVFECRKEIVLGLEVTLFAVPHIIYIHILYII